MHDGLLVEIRDCDCCGGRGGRAADVLRTWTRVGVAVGRWHTAPEVPVVWCDRRRERCSRFGNSCGCHTRRTPAALSRQDYLALARPSQDEPVRRYASVDPGLYDAILGRCVRPGSTCTMMGKPMPPAAHAAHAEPMAVAMAGMDHEP